jgi:recombination protein RecR
MMHDALNDLIDILGRLPGIGHKTAQRLAFHLLRKAPELPLALATALRDVVEQVGTCSICQGLGSSDPCATCADQRRQRETICVVAQPQDINAIEATAEYQGLYHVLHGVLSPLDGLGPEDIRAKELLARLPGDPQIGEVIIALPTSVEGEATSLYLAGLLRPLGIRVTRIAAGIPMGGEIEYADRLTLGRALGDRREI